MVFKIVLKKHCNKRKENNTKKNPSIPSALWRKGATCVPLILSYRTPTPSLSLPRIDAQAGRPTSPPSILRKEA